MPVTINIDVSGEIHANGFDFDIARTIVEHDGRIVYFQYRGPGGGNPQYTIEFPTRDQALAYLRGPHGADDEQAGFDLDHYFADDKSYDSGGSNVGGLNPSIVG